MSAAIRHTLALFGEAERGQYKKAHYLRELPQLVDLFGNPPEDSQGIFFAIQALLYQRDLIYFRVKEEGFSSADYFYGLKLLSSPDSVAELKALCMPGVGCPEILAASQSVCERHKSILITSEKDLYDYLTSN